MHKFLIATAFSLCVFSGAHAGVALRLGGGQVLGDVVGASKGFGAAIDYKISERPIVLSVSFELYLQENDDGDTASTFLFVSNVLYVMPANDRVNVYLGGGIGSTGYLLAGAAVELMRVGETAVSDIVSASVRVLRQGRRMEKVVPSPG